jgi:polysaccharide export outer membrane protein
MLNKQTNSAEKSIMCFSNRVFFFLFAMVGLMACSAPRRAQLLVDQVPSMQAMDSQRLASISRVAPSDRLNIVISSTEPSLTAYLNPFGQSSSSNIATTGYLVNAEGQIEFPLLGKLPVVGLTTIEIADTIRRKLSYYYKDLFVHVNLIGRVYIIQGNDGSVIPLQNERLTILEAMAQVSNRADYIPRNEVWIVREDSGRRQFAQVDLTSKKIFESPFFYLKSNDFIYLKPNNYSWYFSSSSPLRFALTLVGTLSAIVVLITRF